MHESTSPTPPAAVWTGGPSTNYMPEYTGPPSTTQSSSSGLSVGVKAGVGVGVVVGVLVLAALLWFAYILGKRRARAAQPDPPEYDSVVHEEGKEPKLSFDSLDSSKSFVKPSATAKPMGSEKSHASEAKV